MESTPTDMVLQYETLSKSGEVLVSRDSERSEALGMWTGLNWPGHTIYEVLGLAIISRGQGAEKPPGESTARDR